VQVFDCLGLEEAVQFIEGITFKTIISASSETHEEIGGAIGGAIEGAVEG